MNKIPNNENVKTITMRPTAYTKCELGQDWYANNLEIIFVPDTCYPDYTEVQAWIMGHIDGKTLNIEAVAQLVKERLEQYDPKEVTVKNHISGCKTHFDVVVEI